MAGLLLVVVPPLAGCAARAVRPRVAEGIVELAAGPFDRQSLFRVDVDGPEGSGRMRLVLRDGPAAAFQLAASDALGRPLWTLTAAARDVVLVDHRRRAYCSAERLPALPENGLAGLPPEALPRVLRGALPVDVPAAEPEGRVDFLDSRGRRWTAVVSASGLESWALWRGDRPVLWWKAQPRGGILSHRDGSQFRWRETVDEAVEGRFRAEVPEGYHHADCADWDLPELREDQPASAGRGAPS